VAGDEMKIEDIKIKTILPPPTDEMIADVEKQLGVTLPEDYLQFIRTYHRAKFEPSLLYDCIWPTGKHKEGILSKLLAFIDEEVYYSILARNRNFEDRPDKLIFIATDPGWGYTCFDYRETNTNPPLVYWITDYSNQTFHAANSFTELLEKTYYRNRHM
jgi:hypothetical protein